MGFVEAVQECLRKYAKFEGRAGRPEYWWFMLFWFLASAVAAVVSDKLNAVVTLLLILPGLAVASRRLHDVNKSGWLQLVGLVPVIGWLLMLWWLVQPSVGPNGYGAGPAVPKEDPLGIPPGV